MLVLSSTSTSWGPYLVLACIENTLHIHPGTINQQPLSILARFTTTPEVPTTNNIIENAWLIPVVWLQPFTETGIGPGHTTKQSTPPTHSTAFCLVKPWIVTKYISSCPHHLCFTLLPSSHQPRYLFSTPTQQPPSTSQNTLTNSHYLNLTIHQLFDNLQPPTCARFTLPPSMVASTLRRTWSIVRPRRDLEPPLAPTELPRNRNTLRKAIAENIDTTESQ